MWFYPAMIDTNALQKIIRANRNRVELELAELLTEIMDLRKIDEVDFCFNDILSLFSYRQVKADRGQLRKVVPDCWSSTKSLCSAKKLRPAPDSLSYTAYQIRVSMACQPLLRDWQTRILVQET